MAAAAAEVGLSVLAGKIVLCPEARNIPPPTLLVFASLACLASVKDDEEVFCTLIGVAGGDNGSEDVEVEGAEVVDVGI